MGRRPKPTLVYRVRGDFNRVIGNLERLNEFKQQYNSPYPELSYQFVAFGHNQHEIQQARALAERLNMQFRLKLNWDDFHDTPFSPVTDHDLISRESGLGVANRSEFKEKFGEAYLQKPICADMWMAPQVNFDGRVLGCCVNYWDDYGNAFTDGLLKVLNSERMRYARRMLLGKAVGRADIACTTCKFYRAMKESGSWMRRQDIGLPASRISGAVRAVVPQGLRKTVRRLLSW
jgi:hypothetical protein